MAITSMRARGRIKHKNANKQSTAEKENVFLKEENSLSLLKKAPIRVVLAALIIFAVTLLITYSAISLATPEQLGYSAPSDDMPTKPSPNVGGEAFAEDNWVGVFVVGPAPGDTNVSRDTFIFLFETRPVAIDLHLTPETPIARTTKEPDGMSEITTLYPDGLLEPNTTYNVSGTIMGLSAWWTFKTSLEPTQPRMERILPQNTWLITIGAATLTTLIFTLTAILWHRHKLTLFRRIAKENDKGTRAKTWATSVF